MARFSAKPVGNEKEVFFMVNGTNPATDYIGVSQTSPTAAAASSEERTKSREAGGGVDDNGTPSGRMGRGAKGMGTPSPPTPVGDHANGRPGSELAQKGERDGLSGSSKSAKNPKSKIADPRQASTLVQDFKPDQLLNYFGLPANSTEGWRVADIVRMLDEDFTIVAIHPAGGGASFDQVVVGERPSRTYMRGTKVSRLSANEDEPNFEQAVPRRRAPAPSDVPSSLRSRIGPKPPSSAQSPLPGDKAAVKKGPIPRKAPAADEKPPDSEREATRELAKAKNYLKNNLREKAIGILQGIVENHPDTKAAEEATTLLEEHFPGD